MNEEKKAKPEEPKKEVCPTKPAEKKPVASEIKFDSRGLRQKIAFKERDASTVVNGRGTMPPTNGQENKLDYGKKNKSASRAASLPNYNVNSVNKKEEDNLCNELAKELANFKIGVWKGAENEGYVNNAQPPKGLSNDVKVEKYLEVRSAGKAT